MSAAAENKTTKAEGGAFAPSVPSVAADAAARLVLVVLFGFAAFGWIHRIADGSLAAEGAVALANGAAGLLFSALVCGLAVFRRAPLRTASGWTPKAAALGGSYLFTLVNLLPSAEIPSSVQSVVLLLLAASTLLLCASLLTLGRSFSILPEARALVVAGPYAFVRHPVYVAEAAAALAMTISHFSAAAVAVAAAQTFLQFVRVLHEEAVLTQEFPEYAGYAASTPRFLPRLRRPVWAADESGTAAVLLAILLPALVGMTALGVEVSTWHGTKRQLQTAADAAALSAAYQVSSGQSDYAAAAASDAAANGFASGSGSTIQVNVPPASGPYAGDAAAAEVILSQPQGILMAGAFLPSLTITARAVAKGSVSGGSGKYCALGLDTSAASTVSLSNNAVLPNANCGVASNSTNVRGLDLSNNASIAGPVSVAASGYSLCNNASITGAVKENAVVPDPYAAAAPGTRPSCTNQTSSAMNNVTVNLTPGTFCSGLNFANNAVVNMSPGVYYIQSKFAFQNNAVLNATGGVTLVIDGTYAISIGNNAKINLTAPTTGPTAGLAFFGTRAGSPATTQVFSNNTQLNITGAIYFPTQTVELDNNASSNASGCVQLIGQRLSFSNNAALPSNCAGTGTHPIGAGAPAFVE